MTFTSYYHLKSKESTLNIVVREAGCDGKSDVLKVNFGDIPFQHVVPFGYTAWNKFPSRLTCYHRKAHDNTMLSSILFIILVKS